MFKFLNRHTLNPQVTWAELNLVLTHTLFLGWAMIWLNIINTHLSESMWVDNSFNHSLNYPLTGMCSPAWALFFFLFVPAALKLKFVRPQQIISATTGGKKKKCEKCAIKVESLSELCKFWLSAACFLISSFLCPWMISDHRTAEVVTTVRTQPSLCY